MNSSVQFNLDSSQFASNVFSNTSAPVSPIRRPLRKAAPSSRLSPILGASTVGSDSYSSSKDDSFAQPFSPSLASPVARRELAPVLSAIDKQSEQSAAAPFFESLSSGSVNEALVNAIARIVNGRMAIEVEIREGLAREVGRMRDSIYNSEKLAKRYMDENTQLKETLFSMQEDIKMIAESSRAARTEAVAASAITANGQGSNNAAARAVAVMASDLASFKKEIQEELHNVKTSFANSMARLDNAQRVFESKLSIINSTSVTSQDSGEKENTEASRRASESAIKSLSMQVKDLHLQVNSSQEELKKMTSTLAAEGLIVPESSQKQQAGGKVHHRGNDIGLSPHNVSRKPRFSSSSKQGNDVDEALGVADSDHDPSLWSNRVITRALLETYLSGIRSSLEQEAQQRRRELSVVEADYTSKLDKLIAEVGGFRGFVRDEAKTRVDAVVEAMTSAISELSNSARSQSSNLAQMQAALQEEKSWVRENATLMRDTVSARFAGVEQAVRVQARSRVATEQAIGDALLKGLQHEQKAREEGINSTIMKVQDISRSLDTLRERVEQVGVQEELNSLTNAVRTVEQRGHRLEEDTQQSFNILEDRNRKLESDLQSIAAAFGERVDKLDKDTLTTQLLAKRVEERTIAEGRSATEGRHALELSMKIGSQAAAERAETIEKEARSMNHLIESRFSRIESLIREAAVAQAAEASALKAASLALAEEEERQRNSAIKTALDEAESIRKQGEGSVKLAMRQATREIEVKLEARLSAWGDAKEQDIGMWQEGLSSEVAGGLSKLEGDIKRQTVQINKRIADLAAAVNATRKASGLLIPDVIHEDIAHEPISTSDNLQSTEKRIVTSQTNTLTLQSPLADVTLEPRAAVLTETELTEEHQEANRTYLEGKAATKIQAVQKGRIVRKELSKNTKDDARDLEKEPAEAEPAEAEPAEAEPAEAERAEAERAEAEPAEVDRTEVESKAATKIQAVQKGRIVRKELSKNTKDDARDLEKEPLTTFDESFKEHGGEDAEEKIAMVITESDKLIQAGALSSEATKSDDSYNEEHTKAATKIQAVQRGNAVRKEKSVLRTSTGLEEKVNAVVPNETPAPLQASDEQVSDDAPVVTQERVDDVPADDVQADVVLANDTNVPTQDDSQDNIAATKIQAVVKGRAVRKDLSAQKRADEIEKLVSPVIDDDDSV